MRGHSQTKGGRFCSQWLTACLWEGPGRRGAAAPSLTDLCTSWGTGHSVCFVQTGRRTDSGEAGGDFHCRLLFLNKLNQKYTE